MLVVVALFERFESVHRVGTFNRNPLGIDECSPDGTRSKRETHVGTWHAAC